MNNKDNMPLDLSDMPSVKMMCEQLDRITKD